MFTDVYEEMPLHLREQQAALEAHLKRHPGTYPEERHVQ